ncbi:MAG: hypothetical protein IPJ94_29760 [Chloroflexi bacterium]|nr:hypothetical protein [Chloroflexota bacterium]
MSDNLNNTAPEDDSDDYLANEYKYWETLFASQPVNIRHFLEAQARQLADALTQNVTQVHFTLPDQIVLEAGKTPVPVLSEIREQMAGGLLSRLTRADLRTVFLQRLSELESSPERATAVSASLIRHVTAVYMIHNLLPAGRSVTYITAEGEEVPTIPAAHAQEPESAITATTDAIAEEGENEEGRGELLVPYVPAARRFYLPQWVAFDDAGHLLVNSASEAEAYLASMQQFMAVLHAAVAVAPYIMADETYRQKRHGMMGQLINQGRALSHYQTYEIIQTIKQRAAAQDLNRGLRLSLPYFDDQRLEMKTLDFEVTPGGRIMFVPAFVVRAVRLEEAKVAQDTRFNFSTRKYLLIQLEMLKQAFIDPSHNMAR